ncbi:MAG: RagB/SusD family nutrient uptake outer membrane protein [Tannerella sp.]|jgi:hypothetical protein|nr:RagB/SusD family nutrient uptake outer membrane protein [Tannerella sp.]
MKKHILLLTSIVFLYGCTDLSETVYREIVADTYYVDGEAVVAAYLSVYGPLQDVWEENYFNITEFSTDEACRPTRLQNGYDGGQWIRMHRHQWMVIESRVEDVWNKCYKGIGFANTCLADFETLDFEKLRVKGSRSQMIAELRGMRAFYYYMLVDLFGGVPIVTKVNADAPARDSREEVCKFIETELKAVLNDLPVKGSGNDYGKFTQGAAQSILAKLYLNSEVWTGKERRSDCISVCNDIINSGKYHLDAGWQDPFHYFNENSAENIFVIPYDQLHATQMNYPGRFLHYTHAYTFGFPVPSSNGVCTEKSYYEKFKPNDKRIKQWLVGPQFMADGKTPLPCVMDMAGQNLVLDPYIKNMEDGVENSGVRNVKFQIQFGTPDYPQDNDIPVTRYADILMMKAECLLRNNQKAEALAIINNCRARCFDASDPDRAYSDITLDEFLDERAREFSYECCRRQDLIRFGKFNDAWWDKPKTDPSRCLFPIPDARIKANPNMTQNPGYE